MRSGTSVFNKINYFILPPMLKAFLKLVSHGDPVGLSCSGGAPVFGFGSGVSDPPWIMVTANLFGWS